MRGEEADQLEQLIGVSWTLRRKLDQERREHLLTLAGLISAAGGEIRVSVNDVANLTPRTRVEWHDDPRTGERVYRIATPTRD